MIYTEEKMVSACVSSWPEAIKSGCPVDGNTKRQNVKELLALLMKENKHLKANPLELSKDRTLRGGR